MAKKVQSKSSSLRGKQPAKKALWNFPLTRTNFIAFAIGLGVIILGFLLMLTGTTSESDVSPDKWGNPMALNIAPIVLTIGFCILIPYALMKRDKSDTPPSDV